MGVESVGGTRALLLTLLGFLYGTRAVPGVLATFEPMLDYLARRLIGAVRYCAVEQRDLIAELERWRLVRLQKLDALAAGAPPQSLVEWRLD